MIMLFLMAGLAAQAAPVPSQIREKIDQIIKAEVKPADLQSPRLPPGISLDRPLGAEERLSPILMTALATGLALLPITLGGNKPGQEIEHPMAMVILGGLVASTLLNLLLMPALYFRFSRRH